MKIAKRLTEGNVYKNLLLYSLPLILSSVLSLAYNTVDGIIAGKFIGEFTVGAISAADSFATLFNSLFSGFCAGFAIYVSHLFGEGRFFAIKRGLYRVGIILVLMTAAVSIAAIILRNPILDYLQVDPLLREDAMAYFVIYTSGYVIIYLNILFVHALQAVGITSYSLYVSVISALINVGGNIFTILVLDMGVTGIALSTVFSALIGSVMYVIELRLVFNDMKCEKDDSAGSSVKKTLRLALPMSIQQLTFHGVAFLIAPSINALGAAATTGYAITNRLYQIATQTLWAATSAFGCYSGQCVGEGDTLKLRRGLRASFILNSLLILPIIGIVVIFAEPITSLFFPSEYVGEAFTIAVRYARIFLPLIMLQLVGHIYHSYIRSLGNVNIIFAITVLCSTLRVAATLILVPILKIDGVFVAQIFSWGVDALISLAIYALFFRTDAHLMKAITQAKK